jgi:alcohol dehydrogenase
MIPFDFQPRTRIVFGPDKIDDLGILARELDARRAIVVSDPGVIAAGHMQRGVEALDRAGVQSFHFDHVHENPSTRDVAAAVEFARDCRPDLIVGLGGGSSMDCAKGLNFIYTNGGEMRDYWGVGKATKPMLPMIAVPTTAGTGSEAQSFALISDAETHVKMACGDKKAACRIALLDPKLTLTQPRRVTALTGVDALAHALETFVTKRRTAMSLAFSLEAWRLLSRNFGRVLEEPDNLQARGGMQLGACLAGLAIENSMLGAAHALANPLTADFGIVHGQAIGLMLPHVIRFNGLEFPEWYDELYREAIHAVGDNGVAQHGGAEALADFVTRLVAEADLPHRLADCGVPRESLRKLADDAAMQWTGNFNPRAVEPESLRELYEQAF